VTNHTESNMHVGGSVLRPGETQLVEPHLVPPGMGEISTQANDEPPVDPIAELAKGTVAYIIAALPGLTRFDLDELDAYEQTGKARKGVLEAIAMEKLGREPEDPDAGDEEAGE
jgi:hypothetical protein